MLGWRYPEKRGLEKLIEEKKLYPVTILPALTKHILTIFQKEGILLANEVLNVDIDKLSKSNSIPRASLAKIKNQAEILINKK